MARVPPPIHTRWKPGQSGNPGGSLGLPKDIREAKQMNKHECDRLLNKFIHMTDVEKNQYRQKPDATQFDKMIISIIDHAIREGDPVRTNFILDRLIGKVRENVQVTVEMQAWMEKYQEIQRMSPEQQKKLAAKYQPKEIEVKNEVIRKSDDEDAR